jgi:hypothetical protein
MEGRGKFLLFIACHFFPILRMPPGEIEVAEKLIALILLLPACSLYS